MVTDFTASITEVINKQRQYLLEREKAFKQQCDQITALTQQKLKNIQANDTSARQKIYEDQKQLLEEAFKQYKVDLNKSQTQTRLSLEHLQAQREEVALGELEAQMANL